MYMYYPRQHGGAGGGTLASSEVEIEEYHRSQGICFCLQQRGNEGDILGMHW